MSWSPKLRAFAPPSRWAGEEVLLDEGESRHLCGVMRAGEGAEVEVLDGEGRVGRAAVAEAHRKRAVLRVEAVRTAERACPRRVLVQALPREQQMDWIIQKAVELEVAEIVPVQTRHSVARVGAADAERKARRWAEIAAGACKQSGNPWAPVIRAPRGLEAVLAEKPGWLANAAFGALREGAGGYAAWLAGRRAAGAGEVAVLVGPEGDFSDEEQEALLAAGVAPVTLGAVVLRVETAALAMLSGVKWAWEGGGK